MVLIGNITKKMETAQGEKTFFLNNKKPGAFHGNKMFFLHAESAEFYDARSDPRGFHEEQCKQLRKIRYVKSVILKKCVFLRGKKE